MTESINKRRRRICIVATVPYAIKYFMRAHIEVLKSDYDLLLVSSGCVEDFAELTGPHVAFKPISIERKVSISNDLKSLINLWRLFRTEKFDFVHSITPKAGLLTMLAARVAGVPLRFHIFTGQVWATRCGMQRFLLKLFDRLMVMNATTVLADSHSQRSFLIENKIVKPDKIRVLAQGSVAGVNLTRFKYNEGHRQQVRLEHQIPSDAVTFIFLGRLNHDKGLSDLSKAFASAATINNSIHLFIVGPDEENIEVELDQLKKQFPGRVHRATFTDFPEIYMSAADVICLPSYREGFGSVIIEAAAIGLPAIASRIYGITDAVEEDVTGILHLPGSVQEITEAMLKLASDETFRRQMGAAARKRANDKFSEGTVTKALSEFYLDMFNKMARISGALRSNIRGNNA